MSSNAVNGWTSFQTLSSLTVFHQYELFHLSSNALIDCTSFQTLRQLNGFSSVWIFSRFSKCFDWLTFFSHFEQLNGFSSVWIISRAFKCCDCQIHDVMKIFSCTCTHVAEKSREYDEQRCYQMCDKSSLYMYFKKLVFSGFSLPVEPEIRIFFTITWLQ